MVTKNLIQNKVVKWDVFRYRAIQVIYWILASQGQTKIYKSKWLYHIKCAQGRVKSAAVQPARPQGAFKLRPGILRGINAVILVISLLCTNGSSAVPIQLAFMIPGLSMWRQYIWPEYLYAYYMRIPEEHCKPSLQKCVSDLISPIYFGWGF